ncbi:MAG: oligopeptide ABC transporter permease OppB [Rhodobacteraceae bacterium]|nr:oligopeptide ABC transporter permease OppB [Paracoccaceae bacterium]
MLKYTFRRVLVAIPTLLILIIISFLLMHAAPGGPFTSERPLPPQVLANIEAKYGLDNPLYVQLWEYMRGIVIEFDFGPSFQRKDRTVNEIMAQGFPITFTYGGLSFVAATLIGGTLGIVAAIRQNTIIDYFAVGVSIGAQVLPNFVMAPLLVWLFTLTLGWLPGGGWNGGAWQNLIMPVIALSTSYMASISRITRSSMLEVLNSNYIRTARAKGLPERTVILRHALKPSLVPLISYLGVAFVGMITGSVVIDIYFSTGGMGQAFVNSALNRDYSVMMGITILVGALTIVFALLADLLYAWVDPKIRY